MGFGNYFLKKAILCPEFDKTLPGPDRVNSQHIEKKIIYRDRTQFCFSNKTVE